MALVILQHSGFKWGNYILAFHMPLFFLLTGYTMYELECRGKKLYDKRFVDYAKNRFISLIIPYFSFEFLNLMLSIIYNFMICGNSFEMPSALFCIITCSNSSMYPGLCMRFWFLPCLFVTDLLLWGILRVHKKISRVFRAVFIMLLLMFTYLISTYMDRWLFTLDVALLALAFALFGYDFGGAIKSLLIDVNYLKDCIILVLGAVALFFGVKYNVQSILMYDNQYGIYDLFLMGCCGGILEFIISMKYMYLFCTENVKKLFVWIGVNSLAIYPVHLLLISLIKPLMRATIHRAPWIAVFMFAIAMCYPVDMLINRFFPWMLGKKTDPKKI